jgi:ribosomal protein L7Ae-like RNA K-turn-binding protein
MTTKVLNLFGLAMRAGKVKTGEDIVLMTIRNNQAKLVVLASDAGINTTKRITDKSAFYNVPLIHEFSSEAISNAIGKTNRKVIVITDPAFCKMIIEAME